jgi:hypothetical protein
MSLLTNLLAHWTLDEASGTRFDDLGDYDLADHNLVGSAAGLLGNAADFASASAQRLATSTITFPDVSAGLTFHGWVYPTSIVASQGFIFLVDTFGGSDLLIRIEWNQSFETIAAHLYGPSGSIDWNPPAGAAPANAWIRLAVWWDPVDGKGRSQL